MHHIPNDTRWHTPKFREPSLAHTGFSVEPPYAALVLLTQHLCMSRLASVSGVRSRGRVVKPAPAAVPSGNLTVILACGHTSDTVIVIDGDTTISSLVAASQRHVCDAMSAGPGLLA